MRGRFRPPMLAVAGALLGLIALLATLQYRWLGRISDAERERMTHTLSARATAFARDFDRELTLAYTVFQFEPLFGTDRDLRTRLSAQYDRWQAVARHARLIGDIFLASRGDDGSASLQRFDASTGRLTSSEWPAAFADIRADLAAMARETSADGTFVVRTLGQAIREEVPAVVVPTPTLGFGLAFARDAARLPPFLSYTLLVLDRDYITREMLPALARHHFQGVGDGFDYQLAVVSTTGNGIVYQSAPEFQPAADSRVDATVELFKILPQEFAQVTADVRRLSSPVHAAASESPAGAGKTAVVRPTPSIEHEPGRTPETIRRMIVRDPSPLAAGPDQRTAHRERAVVAAVTGLPARASEAKWRLLVKHPSGSLEAAVGAARRRNLLISSSILAILAASLVMIVVSTRTSQKLARQQMEFVAAVSHELRTPLAVIRSAGENLADGVVRDDAQVRNYGALVRSEGRRLSEMVEQILEFAGINSGQRTLKVEAVGLGPLIASVLATFRTLVDSANLRVDVAIPADLPPVAGDEDGLRRVFQNLIANAIKYGADGGWIGISARRMASEIVVSVRDRGIGIAPADQPRIFEPFFRAADVVAAQIQGAGLGLSLVERIVQVHGGRIAVESARGAGSDFTVHLRLAEGHLVKEPGQGTGVVLSHGSSTRDVT
jgi:signal transduction histidine kinase